MRCVTCVCEACNNPFRSIQSHQMAEETVLVQLLSLKRYAARALTELCTVCAPFAGRLRYAVIAIYDPVRQTVTGETYLVLKSDLLEIQKNPLSGKNDALVRPRFLLIGFVDCFYDTVQSRNRFSIQDCIHGVSVLIYPSDRKIVSHWKPPPIERDPGDHLKCVVLAVSRKYHKLGNTHVMNLN